MPRPPGPVHCAWRPVPSALLCQKAGLAEEWPSVPTDLETWLSRCVLSLEMGSMDIVEPR